MAEKARTRAKRIACAIYTRKSSDEGLEQEFNSLHAQREACESYIASQRHEGWHGLAAHYDDGGYSGGTMERPALKRLLGDIAAGKVDRCGSSEPQVDVRFVRRNQRVHYLLNLPAGQVVGLQLRCRHGDARLVRGDERMDNPGRRHIAQPHPDEVAEEFQLDAGKNRRDPEANRNEVENDQQEENNPDDQDDAYATE